jgi:uncharacterized RDD family membrane protein YckC
MGSKLEEAVAEVVTGEAVVLDLTIARFPSRILALLIDILVQLPVLIFVAVVVSATSASHLNTASGAAIYLAGFMFEWIGYPLIFETLSRGKTLGKLALGIRVVSDDGSPERFRQALVRALSAAFIEVWLFPLNLIGIPAGLITSMVSAKGKRLGDMFAGTFVIQERVPRRPELAPVFTVIPPQLLGWAPHLEVSRLSDQTAAAANSFLRRYYDLRPAAREQLGMQLAATVAAQVSPLPPPGTDPVAYLAAVLAVRREREQARLFARQTAAQQGFAPYAAPPGLQPFTASPGGPIGTPATHASPASPVPPGTPAPPQGQPGAGPAHGPTPNGTLPLGPDEMITLAKDDRPDDHGFAAPT